MNEKPTITFLGGVGSATGANFLLKFPESPRPLSILVDCGMFQGDRYATEENQKPFALDPAAIDFLFITHAHADHIGRVPKLIKDGFRGPIYSTPETKIISEIMFDDMATILEREAADRGVTPLYSRSETAQALRQWDVIPYHNSFSLPNGVTVTPKDAGHILGSAYFEFARNGQKLVFSGDLGNTPSPLVKDTEPLVGAKYLLVESVYGDRNHEDREHRVEKLRNVVLDSIKRNGVLIIPAFSLERSQVILYELNNLVEEGKIPSIPVFLDSPLAIKLTAVYKRLKHDFKPSVQQEIASGDDIFKFPRLQFTQTSQQSHHIDFVQNPKIIIAGGGMSTGGRVIGHEKNYLPDARNTILLVGYQAVGTLGRALFEGSKTVSINGEEVPVRAHIDMINGYSSHKDSDHLVEFIAGSRETLKQVFTVMGEPKSSLFLAQRIRDELEIEAIYPEQGSTYTLDF